MKTEHGFDFSDVKKTSPSETSKPKAKAGIEKAGPSLASKVALEQVRSLGIAATRDKISKMAGSETPAAEKDTHDQFDHSENDEELATKAAELENATELSSDLLTEEDEEIEDLTDVAQAENEEEDDWDAATAIAKGIKAQEKKQERPSLLSRIKNRLAK